MPLEKATLYPAVWAAAAASAAWNSLSSVDGLKRAVIDASGLVPPPVSDTHCCEPPLGLQK